MIAQPTEPQLLPFSFLFNILRPLHINSTYYAFFFLSFFLSFSAYSVNHLFLCTLFYFHSFLLLICPPFNTFFFSFYILHPFSSSTSPFNIFFFLLIFPSFSASFFTFCVFSITSFPPWERYQRRSVMRSQLQENADSNYVSLFCLIILSLYA